MTLIWFSYLMVSFLKSIFFNTIFAETSFHIGIFRQYDWYDLCVNGSSQLHTLCAFLCVTGIRFHTSYNIPFKIFLKLGILLFLSYYISLYLVENYFFTIDSL